MDTSQAGLKQKGIAMIGVKKKFIHNSKQERVAVQIDVATWEMIEEILEDHLLGRRMREAEKELPMVREDALKYYAKLKKRGTHSSMDGAVQSTVSTGCRRATKRNPTES